MRDDPVYATVSILPPPVSHVAPTPHMPVSRWPRARRAPADNRSVAIRPRLDHARQTHHPVRYIPDPRAEDRVRVRRYARWIQAPRTDLHVSRPVGSAGLVRAEPSPALMMSPGLGKLWPLLWTGGSAFPPTTRVPFPGTRERRQGARPECDHHSDHHHACADCAAVAGVLSQGAASSMGSVGGRYRRNAKKVRRH